MASPLLSSGPSPMSEALGPDDKRGEADEEIDKQVKPDVKVLLTKTCNEDRKEDQISNFTEKMLLNHGIQIGSYFSRTS